MTTYADVKKQIAQLEKKAADLRKVEVAKAVANIREQMAKYELTADDIAPGKSSKGGKPAARSAKVKVAKHAKYMDPKSGKTWTGHGKAPGWIAAATKAGRRDDFLIGKSSQAKDAKPVVSPKSKTPSTATKATTIAMKAATKMVAAKKPQLAAKKAPVAKKATAAAEKPPVVSKAKPASPAKKTATKAPAKSPAKGKAKVVSKRAPTPTATVKLIKKAKSKPAPTVKEVTPVVAA
jgi:DNA-binding protein H-NS